MKTADIAQMGKLLNMSNVFTLYMNQILAQPDGLAQARLKALRKVIQNEISHIGRDELNHLMNQLTKRTTSYSVLTRYNLEKALECASPITILVVSALLEDEDQQEAFLYLLHHVKHPYKGKELLERFGFTSSTDKNV